MRVIVFSEAWEINQGAYYYGDQSSIFQIPWKSLSDEGQTNINITIQSTEGELACVLWQFLDTTYKSFKYDKYLV